MNSSNQSLNTATGSSLLVDRRHHKEGGSDLHEITIQDIARFRDDATLLNETSLIYPVVSPPRTRGALQRDWREIRITQVLSVVVWKLRDQSAVPGTSLSLDQSSKFAGPPKNPSVDSKWGIK
ncbi:hypothetical protein AVEN_94487-1 [Araneus ventricosus]|uniref:Uncharacterized protein n=1 Tax=Araneus ventricosus TaxID=182803 RepID=A0A4Y2E9R0_ARAVE|nr:hypothetical protein AVEN_94487-1 [Araneus ventricosus]